MQLSVEVLDHIFTFLLADRQSLSACSKVALLSPIVERHLYYHVTVQIRKDLTDSSTLEPERLSNLVSENPLILNYVRILQIELVFTLWQDWHSVLKRLDKFANTFPALRCIILIPKEYAWHWTSAFLAALEDRLNLPTIKEIHLVGGENFPFSLLDACKHVKNLSLSGAEGHSYDSILPQLQSLALSSNWISSSLLAWLKCHINELESLKCACYFLADILPELLRVCSETLNKLEVDLTVWQEYSHSTEPRDLFMKLSPIPPNLQQLTIRTTIYWCHLPSHGLKCHQSNLPAAADIINQLISSPRYLRLFRVLNIDIDLSTLIDSIIDFSPLNVLGAASLSIPRINLYVHARGRPAITHIELMPLLDNYEGIMKSIRTGVLVVHPGKMAPDA